MKFIKKILKIIRIRIKITKILAQKEIKVIIKSFFENVYKIIDNNDMSSFYEKIYKDMYSKPSLIKKKFYNIGAGNFYHKYWTNIDKLSDWYYNKKENRENIINYDLFDLKPLPLATSSAEIIYCSHVIEHISNNATSNLF